ncbi:MAG: polyhydroxyalkanoic acid system family protein [Pseudoxanthomonas sp.]
MARIDIVHAHARSPAQARQAIDAIARTLADRYGLRHAWQGERLSLSGSGIQAGIDNLPGQVRVSAELGLLASALKGTIEQEIRRVLAEKFG